MSKLTHRSRYHQKQQRHKTQTSVPIYKKSPTHQTPHSNTPVINSSVAKQIYRAPERSAYKIFKYNNTFFNADRHKQPLPRSSYNREYLINPPSLNQRYLPRDNNVMMGKTASDRFLHSSYQADFKNKQADKINYKELDAYQNKIK